MDPREAKAIEIRFGALGLHRPAELLAVNRYGKAEAV